MTGQTDARPAGAVVAFAGAAGAFVSLDTTVNIALPSITKAFAIDVGDAQWIVISYVLTYASLLLLTGRLADTFGHHRILRAGLVTSVVAMVACGAAQVFGWFLAGRVLQGVGAALVLGAAPALVTLSAPESERTRALGVFQMAAAIGLAAGPPLGGVLVEAWGWRAVYLFRVPAALVVVGLALALRSGSANTSPAAADGAAVAGRGRLDLPGAATFGVGTASLLFAISRARDLGWTSPLVSGGIAIGVAVLALWWRVELRAPYPVLDVRLFRRGAFSVANVLNVAANGAQFAIWLLVPYYLLSVIGYRTVPGGAVLGSAPAASAVAALAAGRLERRVGATALVCGGLALEAAGLGLISRLGASSQTPAIVGALALSGLGLGLFQVPNVSSVMGTLPRAAQGVAGALTQMMRTIGVISGVTFASLLFSTQRDRTAQRLGVAPGDPDAFVPAFRTVLATVALIAAAACALALVTSRLRASPPPPSNQA